MFQTVKKLQNTKTYWFYISKYFRESHKLNYSVNIKHMCKVKNKILKNPLNKLINNTLFKLLKQIFKFFS